MFLGSQWIRQKSALWIALLTLAALNGDRTAAADEPAQAVSSQEGDLQAARELFERNLGAIQRQDRDGYLATYWQSESLARNGFGGVQLGYTEHADNSSGDNWPDLFEGRQLQLVWLQPGIVYGSYRYRVAYGNNESNGISERIFLKTADGWRIAMTSAFQAPDGTPPPPMALVGATLIDGGGGAPIVDAHVIVRSGRIDCAGPADSCPVPAGIESIDVQGNWITPGLIDTHAHFSQSGWIDARPDLLDATHQFPFAEVQAALQQQPEDRLAAWLACGVTTVFDLGGFPWTWDLRTAERNDRPHIVACGPALSYRPRWPGLPAAQQVIQLQGSDDILDAMTYLKSHNADAVKFLWSAAKGNSAELTVETVVLTSVANAAKQQGLALFTDANTLQTAKVAVAAGATLLTHGIWDAPLDEEFLEAARAAGTSYCPALTTVANQVRFDQAAPQKRSVQLDDPFAAVDSTTAARIAMTSDLSLSADETNALLERSVQLRLRLQTMRNNLQKALAAGIPIVLGTNAGSPLTLHGPAIFGELEAMQAAGMPPMQVLLAATRNASRLVPRAQDRGELRADTIADLLILEADPTLDISNMRRQVAVMRYGELRWKTPR